jgi:hypothetical protein
METFNEKQIKMERTLDLVLAQSANYMKQFAGDVLLTRSTIIDKLLCWGNVDCFCHRMHFDSEERFKGYYGRYVSAAEMAIKELGEDFILRFRYDREKGTMAVTIVIITDSEDDLPSINELAERVKNLGIETTVEIYKDPVKKD